MLADGLLVAGPAEMGLDPVRIDSVLVRLAAGKYPNVHSFLLAVNDRLVIEEYYGGYGRGSLHELRSATKSVGSMLVGLALDRGTLGDLDVKVAPFFREDYEPDGGWDPRVENVSLSHLMTMTSGFDCDDLATHFGCEDPMYDSHDWVSYALRLPMAYEPGEHWAYNSPSLVLAGEIVARVENCRLADFARKHLFGPLGIEDFNWALSPRGRAWIGGGARARPRDMLKLGLLMLNEGVWQGRRVLSREWVAASTAPAVDMHNGVMYAHLWQTAPAYIGEHRLEPYWASGNGGQYIVVFPTLKAVAVFTGGNYNDPAASLPMRLLHEFVVPAIVKPEPERLVELDEADQERWIGVYGLDFAPEAKVHIWSGRDGLMMRTPDDEVVGLSVRAPNRCTGHSVHGSLTLFLCEPKKGMLAELLIYGAFAQFRFVAEDSR